MSGNSSNFLSNLTDLYHIFFFLLQATLSKTVASKSCPEGFCCLPGAGTSKNPEESDDTPEFRFKWHRNKTSWVEFWPHFPRCHISVSYLIKSRCKLINWETVDHMNPRTERSRHAAVSFYFKFKFYSNFVFWFACLNKLQTPSRVWSHWDCRQTISWWIRWSIKTLWPQTALQMTPCSTGVFTCTLVFQVLISSWWCSCKTWWGCYFICRFLLVCLQFVSLDQLFPGHEILVSTRELQLSQVPLNRDNVFTCATWSWDAGNSAQSRIFYVSWCSVGFSLVDFWRLWRQNKIQSLGVLHTLRARYCCGPQGRDKAVWWCLKEHQEKKSR